MFASIFLALAENPFSSENGLSLSISLPAYGRPVISVLIRGARPKDTPIIQCGYGTFWPEVIEQGGQKARLSKLGDSMYKDIFAHHGSVRDKSFNIFAMNPYRKNHTPNLHMFGEYDLRQTYDLQPGRAYRVRGIYDNRADGRPIFMRSRFTTFTYGPPETQIR